MDTLGIIRLVKLTIKPGENIDAMVLPIVNFRFLARNTSMSGFEIYDLNKRHIYNNIEEVELYHQHLEII